MFYNFNEVFHRCKDYDERLKESKKSQNMISADAARQETKKNTHKSVVDELNKLERQIVKATSKGEFSISNIGCL